MAQPLRHDKHLIRPTFRIITLAALALLVAPGQTGVATTAVPPAEVKVTLKPSGFEPAEVTRDAGPIRLTVTNSSGQGALTFRLSKPGGPPLHSSALAEGAAEWSQEFNLPAGRYVLTVADHPEWNLYVNLL